MFLRFWATMFMLAFGVGMTYFGTKYGNILAASEGAASTIGLLFFPIFLWADIGLIYLICRLWNK